VRNPPLHLPRGAGEVASAASRRGREAPYINVALTPVSGNSVPKQRW
jgi:hypothetical protein